MDYLETARRIVSDLKTLKASEVSFWQAANGFDTWIDFLDEAKADKNEVKAAFDLMKKIWGLKDLNSTWFDDFGWWTIAAQKATTKSFFTKEQKDWLKYISNEGWRRFNDNAPYVWFRAPTTLPLHNYPKHPVPDVSKSDWQPVVGGPDKRGAWNEYWCGTPDSGPRSQEDNTEVQYQGPKDGDPTGKTGDVFQGVQNTVTNLLYLISAGRMGDKTAAEREHKFLWEWFEGPKVKDKVTHQEQSTTPLLWREPSGPNPDRALIRERVSALLDHNLKFKPAPGFDQNAFWVGDQGLLIGALVDRIKANSAEQAASVKLIGAVLKGIADPSNRLVKNGVLQSYTPVGGHLKPYAGDYQTGASVLWHYVLYAWNADIPGLRDAINNSKIKPVLAKSAEAAAGTTSFPRTRVQPTPPEVFRDLINDIAALVAAHAIRP
jgi:hypothetical protein